MKKILKYSLLFLIILIPFMLVGCFEKDNDNDGDNSGGGNNTPTTYTVNITVNNSDYGRVNIDNLKVSYDSGDYINLTVQPNEGYYLRGYSDNNSKSLTRQVVVNGNMDIVVNFAKGEACSYYGYYIAVENEIDTKTMTIRNGNTGTFVKPYPNREHNLGSLRFSYSKANTPTCFFFKHSKTGSLLAKSSSTTTYVTLSEQDFINAFGADGKGEWIDVVESNDCVGSAYVVTIVGQGKDNACFTSEGKFSDEKFENSELVYVLFEGGEVKHKLFEKVGDSEYRYELVGTKTKFIQTFKLFLYNNEIYYCTNPNVEYMVTSGETRTYNITLNNVDYSLVFDYTK